MGGTFLSPEAKIFKLDRFRHRGSRPRWFSHCARLRPTSERNKKKGEKKTFQAQPACKKNQRKERKENNEALIPSTCVEAASRAAWQTELLRLLLGCLSHSAHPNQSTLGAFAPDALNITKKVLPPLLSQVETLMVLFCSVLFRPDSGEKIPE